MKRLKNFRPVILNTSYLLWARTVQSTFHNSQQSDERDHCGPHLTDEELRHRKIRSGLQCQLSTGSSSAGYLNYCSILPRNGLCWMVSRIVILVYIDEVMLQKPFEYIVHFDVFLKTTALWFRFDYVICLC